MAKNENKTQANEGDVVAYLNSVEHEQKRVDSFKIMEMMREVTGHEAQMWGKSIVGFGKYGYRYESGREGDWFLTGFAPRKQSFTLYIMAGFDGYDELLAKLGKYKTGKSCLYINKLADVDQDVLREIVHLSAEHVKANSVE